MKRSLKYKKILVINMIKSKFDKYWDLVIGYIKGIILNACFKLQIDDTFTEI